MPVDPRPATGTIPAQPGVYRFLDAHGQVIYVGKARSLRSRLVSYFAPIQTLHPRTAAMVTAASDVQWTVVASEVEALQLEYTWIKEFDPRFNVRFRDDKSYPYLAVTLGERFPRAMVVRGAKQRGTRYFGPYTHAWAIRESLDLMLRLYPVRTCSAGVYRRAEASGRACLLGYIDKCSAPCVGKISEEEHRAIAIDLCDFLAGGGAGLQREITREMEAASADLDFERAARLRDDAAAVAKVLQRSAVVLPEGVDADVLALSGDELEVAFHMFFVRGGRITGQRGWVAERSMEGDADMLEHLLMQVYESAAHEIPREILLSHLPADLDPLGGWLSERRGAQVNVRIPQRGEKAALMATALENAQQTLARHKVTRAGDLTARGEALEQLQGALGLTEAPLRIECVDISHVQGTHVVGSLVVFEDGLPRKSDYRHYKVTEGLDDTAAIREVLRRRLTHLLHPERDEVGPPESAAQPKRNSFAYPPSLLVIDGGQPQAAVAHAVCKELGLSEIAVVGMAKRLEELWLPGEDFPVILPRGSAALYLLQRVRDEAHRFAISFHRKRRSKAMTRSALDDIPGVGPARAAALLGAFGSVAGLRRASVEQIAQVPGVSTDLAARIWAQLHESAPEAAVNVTTGELLDEPRTGPGGRAGEPAALSPGLNTHEGAATGENVTTNQAPEGGADDPR